MHILGKEARRAIKRVTLGWRYGLVDRAPDWMRQRFGATAAWLDMLLVDHGVFRLIYVNLHPIGPVSAANGKPPQAWRSAQPAPRDLTGLARRGVRTIVNLRGERLCGSYWLERRACARLGLKLVDYQVRSRAAPSKTELRGARDLFQTVEYPILLHCKSGADRAGLMSVLYRHLHEGVPMAEAIKQLSWRYGHIRQADTGVLDAFFERYLSDTATRPMPFFEWVETVYDPDSLKRNFQSKGWANRLVDTVLQRE